MNVTQPAIAITGLGKTFRTGFGHHFQAVRDLTLDLPTGTVFGLLGPNGAGKTTTILMLLGILRPSSGSFSLFGCAMESVAVRSRVGYLPEKFQLPGCLRAAEFLRFHGRMHGLNGSLLEERIGGLLCLVGLGDHARSRIGAFSKGMQQRLALAQALLNDPDLVILDEPTSALDPVGRMEVRSIITALKARGKTVLLNSHILSDVERVCDNVAILNKGCLERQGAIADLSAQAIELKICMTGLSEQMSGVIAGMGHNLRVARSGDLTELTLEIADQQVVPRIADAICAGGGKLFALTPIHESLEDIFVRALKE